MWPHKPESKISPLSGAIQNRSPSKITRQMMNLSNTMINPSEPVRPETPFPTMSAKDRMDAINEAVDACRGFGDMFLLTRPPASGKTIEFTFPLAVRKNTSVICIQIDEAATHRACARTTAWAKGGSYPHLRIASYKDDDPISVIWTTKSLMYVSYRWLERIAKNCTALLASMSMSQRPVFFVLGGVHVMTLGQDLGFRAVRDIWRQMQASQELRHQSKDLKFVLATSYPESGALTWRFEVRPAVQLNLPQAAASSSPCDRVYLEGEPEEWLSPRMYGQHCRDRIKAIFQDDPKAHVLVFLMSKDQAMSITRGLRRVEPRECILFDESFDPRAIDQELGPRAILVPTDVVAAVRLQRLDHILLPFSRCKPTYNAKHGTDEEAVLYMISFTSLKRIH